MRKKFPNQTEFIETRWSKSCDGQKGLRGRVWRVYDYRNDYDVKFLVPGSSKVWGQLLATGERLTKVEEVDLDRCTQRMTVHNPAWGGGINLFDDEKNTPVTLKEDQYSIDFPTKFMPFTDPRIRISDSSGHVVLTMKIPADKIKDDGTFELYLGDSKSATQFNILGGRREFVLDRKRYAAVRQSCTYTETYSCDKTCTDSKGNSYSCSGTCTRTRIGDQDAVHEIRHVKSFYRILFDGFDLMNAGAFSGESAVQEVDVEIASTSCG